MENKTKRLEILENSLKKKEELFSRKIGEHFDTVRRANGQPLNDKRNGRATLNKWEKQNNALRNLKDSIEKTKNAIEVEKGKIFDVQQVNEVIPRIILDYVEKGLLHQWRKHPETFFVNGVEKGRIVWDKKAKVLGYRYFNDIPTIEQKRTFQEIYNNLYKLTNA